MKCLCKQDTMLFGSYLHRGSTVVQGLKVKYFSIGLIKLEVSYMWYHYCKQWSSWGGSHALLRDLFLTLKLKNIVAIVFWYVMNISCIP